MKRHLGLAILTWFIAVSLCLIIAILFLENELEDEIPLIINNLWETSLLIIPTYLLVILCLRKNDLAIITAAILTLAISLSTSLWEFPNAENISFTRGKEAEDTAITEEELDEPDDSPMELPDEL